jgi:ferredoxin
MNTSVTTIELDKNAIGKSYRVFIDAVVARNTQLRCRFLYDAAQQMLLSVLDPDECIVVWTCLLKIDDGFVVPDDAETIHAKSSDAVGAERRRAAKAAKKAAKAAAHTAKLAAEKKAKEIRDAEKRRVNEAIAPPSRRRSKCDSPRSNKPALNVSWRAKEKRRRRRRRRSVSLRWRLRLQWRPKSVKRRRRRRQQRRQQWRRRRRRPRSWRREMNVRVRLSRSCRSI